MKGKYGSSGFNDANISVYDSKYFDIYPNSSSEKTYNNRILGDATGELGPFSYYPDSDSAYRNHTSWYSDYAYFVSGNSPWFARGGRYTSGNLAGSFAFYVRNGTSVDLYSFRVVLVK